MLTKLTKYEWMATARYLIPLYLVLAFTTVFSKVLFSIPLFDGKLAFIPMLFFVLYIISLISIAITTFLLIIMRFYKNLMTGEGYLMFTLPVKVHELITSKLVISLIWVVTSCILCFVSLLIVIPSAASLDPDFNSFTLSSILDALGSVGTIKIILFALFMLLMLAMNILMFYTSIATGQMISSNKVFGSIIAYIGIYTVFQAAASILIFLTTLLPIDFYNVNEVTNLVLIFGIVLSIIGNFVFYYVTNIVLKKRLNLE